MLKFVKIFLNSFKFRVIWKSVIIILSFLPENKWNKTCLLNCLSFFKLFIDHLGFSSFFFKWTLCRSRCFNLSCYHYFFLYFNWIILYILRMQHLELLIFSIFTWRLFKFIHDVQAILFTLIYIFILNMGLFCSVSQDLLQITLSPQDIRNILIK